MNHILRRLEKFSGVYLDDTPTFSETWPEHLNHVKQVLQRIYEAGLTIKKSKCEFATAVVSFLGHVVGHGEIRPNKAKVEAIRSFPRPTDRKQLRKLLGVISFYRRYIPHLAHIVAVWTDMLKKGVKFKWSGAAEQAFVHVKSLLSNEPILRAPNFNKNFQVAVDASVVAVGAVLLQEHNGVPHPICYYSKRLNQHQSRYSVIERECLALMLAVKVFSIYFDNGEVTVYIAILNH